MKTLITFLFIILLSINIFAQSSPTLDLRIPNATTAFSQNIPIGTKVYNVADGKYWIATAGVISTATLTTASASFVPIVTSVTGTGPIVSSGGGSPAISISAATQSTAGSLSATDKTKLDGIASGAIVGVIPNSAITGATKTKITYDTKGLVTSGADATTSDIGEGTNLYYTDTRADARVTSGITNKVDKVTGKGLSEADVSSAEKTAITHSNRTALDLVSGTNTGDETGTTIKSKLSITTLSGSNTGDQDISAMTHSNRTVLDAVSGTNTGDETVTTIKSKLGISTLSGSNTGDQDITAMTHSNRTALDAVSGTNTGDNATNSQYSGLAASKINASEKEQANGVATLDVNGKVPLTQINDVLLGAVTFKGTYNASTNSPALPTVATTNKGWYYIISIAGTQASLDLKIGDWIVSNGEAWGKVDNNNTISTVFGRVGAISANSGDYTTDQVTEGTKKYVSTAEKSTWNAKQPAGAYLTSYTETDPIFGAWNKSTGISITKSQVSDFGNLETAFSKNTGFNKNFGTTTGTVLEGRTFGTIANSNTGDYLPIGGGTLTGALIGTSATFSGIIVATDEIAAKQYTNTLGYFFSDANFKFMRLDSGWYKSIAALDGVFYGNIGAVDATFSGSVTAPTGLFYKTGLNTAGLSGQVQLRTDGKTAGDAIGLTFTLNNDYESPVNYGRIKTTITQADHLIYSGKMTFDVMQSGANVEALTLTGGSATFAGTVTATGGNSTQWNAKQPALNGTGFVKASGTTISYDNTAYITTASIPAFVTDSFEEFATGTTGQVNTLTYTLANSFGLLVSLNGYELKPSQFTVSANTVKITIPIYQYDAVTIAYTGFVINP